MKAGLTAIDIDVALRDMRKNLEIMIANEVYEFYKKTHLIPDISVDILHAPVTPIGERERQVFGGANVRARVEFEAGR